MRSLRLCLPGLLALVLFASGCPRPARPPITRAEDALVAPSSAVSLRDDGDVESLKAAVAQSLIWLQVQPPGRALVFGPRVVSAGRMLEVLTRLHARLATPLSPEELEAIVRADFEVLESAGGPEGGVLFTGYYEPVLEASLTRDAEYATPLHAAPADLIEVPLEPFADRFKGEKVFGRLEGKRLVPYFTRAEILGGKLAGRGLELAYAKDPVAVFFLQVQGSGVLRLPDGSERRVGYAAANGRPYRSIGARLIERGLVAKEAMSMQVLKAWLAANPSERDALLDYNESYVFFRFLEGASLGNLGRPVTPGRSIATDVRMFPPGALAFIQTEQPEGSMETGYVWKPLARFMLNQDTGGAIRGPGRVDIFWGRGPAAELSAGLMKQKGRLFFLVPKVESPAAR